MKRIFALLFALTLTVSLIACTEEALPDADTASDTVLAPATHSTLATATNRDPATETDAASATDTEADAEQNGGDASVNDTAGSKTDDKQTEQGVPVEKVDPKQKEEKPTVPETDPKPKTEPTNPPVSNPVHTHSYTKEVVAPTCTADGYTLNVCSCGDSFTTSPKKALGHDYQAVYEEESVYEMVEKSYCVTCGADMTSWNDEKITEHCKSHALAGESDQWRTVGEQVQVGTEKTLTGYVCTRCGAEK